MKRMICLLVLATLLFGTVACSRRDKTTTTTTPVVSTPAGTTVTTPTPVTTTTSPSPVTTTTTAPTPVTTTTAPSPVTTTTTAPVTTTTPAPEPPAPTPFDGCDATGALSVTRVTAVTFGGDLLAKEERQTDLVAGTYTATVTLRNEIGASEPFTVRTASGTDATVWGRLPLSEDTVANFEETANGGSGNVDGATLAALLGVSESPADGASVTFSVAEGHIASLLIVYQTDAGNTVTVTLAFSY